MKLSQMNTDRISRKTLAVILVGVFLFTNTLSWAQEERFFSTGMEKKAFSSDPVTQNNKLAPPSKFNSEDFKYSLTVAAICKHVERDGNLDDTSYLNNVLARLSDKKNSNIAVLPHEIIIEIPNEGLAIRYFDPTKANVITPYSDTSRLETKVIGPRLNRQVIHRMKALPINDNISYFINKRVIAPFENEAPDSIRARLIKMFLPIRAIEEDKSFVMDGYVPGPYFQKEIKNTSEDEANTRFRNRMIESEIGLLCNLNPERKPDKESLIREAKEVLNNVLSLRINEQNIFVDTITNAESNIIVMQCIKLVFFNNIYYDQYNPYANVNEAVNAILVRRLTERGSLMSYTELLKEAVSSAQAKFFFSEKQYRTEDTDIAYHEIRGRIEQENSQKVFDSVNAIQGFLEEIKKGEKAVTYIVDDNGEVVYHLYLIQKYLEDNPVLKIILIPRAGQYREDASYEDVARLLKQPLFSKLAGYMETNRFKIVKNGPLLSGIDLARMSDEARRAIETCDFIFSVGCVNFEMLNGVKKDSYQIVMVYSTPSQLYTGNKKGDYLFRHFKAGERYLKPIKLAKIEDASKKDAFAKGQMDYSYKNKSIFKDILGGNKPDTLVRVPVEAIESVGIDNIKDFLATFQEAPNGYVELYYMSGVVEVSESVYQKYGLQKKPLPKDFKRTRENTVTLFPAFKGEEINQSTIVSRLGAFDVRPDNTILSPIGLQHDPAGLIRATILGLKMMDIARQIKEKGIDITKNQVFKDKIQLEILEQLKDVCDADDLKNFNLTPDDIIALATGTINNIITALKKLIKLLPITPIDADGLKQIYEHVKEIITAA